MTLQQDDEFFIWIWGILWQKFRALGEVHELPRSLSLWEKDFCFEGRQKTKKVLEIPLILIVSANFKELSSTTRPPNVPSLTHPKQNKSHNCNA